MSSWLIVVLNPNLGGMFSLRLVAAMRENTYPLMMDLEKDTKSAFSVHVRVTARTEGKERSRRLQEV